MRHLANGVNTSIRSACAGNCTSIKIQSDQRFLEGRLDSRHIGLKLAPMKVGATILNQKSDSG